jgi:hypothetical protein
MHPILKFLKIKRVVKMMALLMAAGVSRYPRPRGKPTRPAAGIIRKKPRDHLSPLRTLGIFKAFHIAVGENVHGPSYPQSMTNLMMCHGLAVGLQKSDFM